MPPLSVAAAQPPLGALLEAAHVRATLPGHSVRWGAGWWLLAVGLLALASWAVAGGTAERPAPRFVTVVLGAGGGPSQDDLSAYLLAPAGSGDFVALDAGTLLSGIRRAHALGSFGSVRPPLDSPLAAEGWILRHAVKAYLVSHAHLDHVAGLVIDSPEDASKEILGLTATIDRIRDHLFNWKVWPNFADEGQGTPLKKYRYVRLSPGQEHPIAGTGLTVEAFPLSHGGDVSTAFLLRAGESYVLYLGDTGPDAVERSDRMAAVWARVAPLVRDRRLRGIFLETSYPEGRPDTLLFGHLTPTWALRELRRLAELAGPSPRGHALRDLVVVVTHVKPVLERGPVTRDRIAKQLGELNDLGVRFIVARQGQRIEF